MIDIQHKYYENGKCVKDTMISEKYLKFEECNSGSNIIAKEYDDAECTQGGSVIVNSQQNVQTPSTLFPIDNLMNSWDCVNSIPTAEIVSESDNGRTVKMAQSFTEPLCAGDFYQATYARTFKCGKAEEFGIQGIVSAEGEAIVKCDNNNLIIESYTPGFANCGKISFYSWTNLAMMSLTGQNCLNFGGTEIFVECAPAMPTEYNQEISPYKFFEKISHEYSGEDNCNGDSTEKVGVMTGCIEGSKIVKNEDYLLKYSYSNPNCTDEIVLQWTDLKGLKKEDQCYSIQEGKTNFTMSELIDFNSLGCMTEHMNGLPECTGRGSCNDSNSGEPLYACDCDEPTLYGGETCQYAICYGKLANELTACSGNGDCNTPGVCECRGIAYGDECETYFCATIPSASNLACNSSGICIFQDVCNCTQGYAGQFCEYHTCNGIIHVDKEHVCSGNGDCTDVNVCECDDNFGGDDCQYMKCTAETINNPLVCNQNGTCDGNECSCYSGYYGEYCELFKCGSYEHNDLQACNSHGKCVAPDTCVCDSGYDIVDFCKYEIGSVPLQQSPFGIVGGIIGFIVGGFIILVFLVIIIALIVLLVIFIKKNKENTDLESVVELQDETQETQGLKEEVPQEVVQMNAETQGIQQMNVETQGVQQLNQNVKI